MILSTLKEKIYILANKLREAKEYEIFRNLMKELRLIESDINHFQVIMLKLEWFERSFIWKRKRVIWLNRIGYNLKFL